MNKSNKTGRTHLLIVHGYRDTDGKAKQKTVKKVGYLDELEKIYNDPISHFRAVASEMDKERLLSKKLTVTLDVDEELPRNNENRKNYGHVVFSKIYHELEIDRFLKNARRHKNFEYNTDAIMRLLVFTRLLYPGSKMSAFHKKGKFFDDFKFSLDDTYNALDHFDEISKNLQRHLHEKVTGLYGRKVDLVYYDVTNYYFEIDKQDELRRNGPSKEKRKKPIVQMGLLLDEINLPIMYKLFPGNTHDSQTLMPILTEVQKTYNVGRIVTVADKGLNSGDNIAYCVATGNGYIYSKSVRGAGKDFKEWVLDEFGYHKLTEQYKYKSRIVPDAPIQISTEQIGKKKKKTTLRVEQKWIVFYSKKYAARSKHKREETIAKAMKMIANPSQYKNNVDYGATGYIKNIKIDKSTGEIINIEDTLFLDLHKVEEDAKYDGYYAIITSELDTPDTKIISTYKELWHIEDTFKITKSVLETRPIYLRDLQHINAHFLICFIALLIARIVENKLGGRYTIETINETLRNVECSLLDQNIWLFDFASDVTDDINATFGTNFGKKVMPLYEIKKCLAHAKA